jgi:medium-chain acyl-[acyl-carrier-protein] hydrolase
MTINAGQWAGWRESNAAARLRLFCFPYGGGGATAFRTWQDSFPPAIEVRPVQIPGREERLNEPRFTRLQPLVEAIADALRGLLDKPFALFGHSLGAMIAFQFARHLRKEGLPQPVHLFVSGRRAPQVGDSSRHIYDLPADEFIASLRRRNYVRGEILDRVRLLELLMPILRADYEIVQTYAYEVEEPFDFPVTAFGGKEDSAESVEKLEPWREQTREAFALHLLPGDHFFVHASQPSLLSIIAEQLQPHLLTSSRR